MRSGHKYLHASVVPREHGRPLCICYVGNIYYKLLVVILIWVRYVQLMQEQESVLRLCVAVAKSGNVDACKFGASCRFTHDIDAYLAQVLLYWPFLIWSSP